MRRDYGHFILIGLMLAIVGVLLATPGCAHPPKPCDTSDLDGAFFGEALLVCRDYAELTECPDYAAIYQRYEDRVAARCTQQ